MPSQAQAKPQVDTAHRAVKGDLTIATRALAAMIDKTIFAVSPDEARYNLGGVLVEAASPGVARSSSVNHGLGVRALTARRVT